MEEFSAADMIAKEMKYKLPSIIDLVKTKLADDEIDFLKEHIDREKMTDNVAEYWLYQDYKS